MEYLSVREIAEKWGISLRRVQVLCADGQIPGAVNHGKQWLIPSDVQRPIDRRKKTVDLKPPMPYLFPLFLYTRNLAALKLPDAAQELQHGAVLYLQGKYAESIAVLRMFTGEAADVNARFCATAMITLSMYMLGMNREYADGIRSMQEMAEHESEHQEDYRLCYQSLQSLSSFNISSLLDLGKTKLSDDGLLYCQIFLFMIQSYTAKQASSSSLAAFELICRKLDRDEIQYGAAFLHTLLGISYSREMNRPLSEYHIKQACELILKNNWLPSLALVYPAIPATFNKFLVWGKHNYVLQMRSYTDRALINTSVFDAARADGELLLRKDMEMETNQIFHLLISGLKNREIAEVMDIPLSVVNRKLKSLIEKTGVKDRAALCRLAREQYRVK